MSCIKENPEQNKSIELYLLANSSLIRESFSLSESSTFLTLALFSNRRLRLDTDHYITRMMIPPLKRIFDLVGADVEGWYREMAKSKRVQNNTNGAPTERRLKLDEIYKSDRCVACDGPNGHGRECSLPSLSYSLVAYCALHNQSSVPIVAPIQPKSLSPSFLEPLTSNPAIALSIKSAPPVPLPRSSKRSLATLSTALISTLELETRVNLQNSVRSKSNSSLMIPSFSLSLYLEVLVLLCCRIAFEPPRNTALPFVPSNGSEERSETLYCFCFIRY